MIVMGMALWSWLVWLALVLACKAVGLFFGDFLINNPPKNKATALQATLVLDTHILSTKQPEKK